MSDNSDFEYLIMKVVHLEDRIAYLDERVKELEEFKRWRG